jgi:hypothetical protein
VTRWHVLAAAVVAAVVVLALGVPPTVLAQADHHIGTWKLNLAKSNSTPPPTTPPPQSVVRTYEPFEGKGIKATFVTIAADGTRTTTSFSAHFDGKDYPWTGTPPTGLASIALKRVDAYTWAATNKGKVTGVINTGTNTVSKDGKTLTYTSKGTNAQGQPVSGVQVFERQ